MIPEWNSFINADCMEYLKVFPDNYFDLALVDPPYGEGLASEGGCKGWFAKYHQNAETPENLGGASASAGTDSVKGSTGIRRHYAFGMRKCQKNYQKMMEDANRKKSYRGTLPLKENTSNNSFVSHGTK